jgi:hypothetical protein
MGKKPGKVKIPKQIAGVKIPKGARKAGKKAIKLAAEHPVISDIVAAGLLAAAAALTKDRKLQDAARELGGEARKAASRAVKAGISAKVAGGSVREALLDELGTSVRKAKKAG